MRSIEAGRGGGKKGPCLLTHPVPAVISVLESLSLLLILNFQLILNFCKNVAVRRGSGKPCRKPRLGERAPGEPQRNPRGNRGVRSSGGWSAGGFGEVDSAQLRECRIHGGRDLEDVIEAERVKGRPEELAWVHQDNSQGKAVQDLPILSLADLDQVAQAGGVHEPQLHDIKRQTRAGGIRGRRLSLQ